MDLLVDGAENGGHGPGRPLRPGPKTAEGFRNASGLITAAQLYDAHTHMRANLLSGIQKGRRVPPAFPRYRPAYGGFGGRNRAWPIPNRKHQ